MTDPILLTIDAILLTLRGDAPISIWFPLIEDIFTNTIGMIANLFGMIA